MASQTGKSGMLSRTEQQQEARKERDFKEHRCLHPHSSWDNSVCFRAQILVWGHILVCHYPSTKLGNLSEPLVAQMVKRSTLRETQV